MSVTGATRYGEGAGRVDRGGTGNEPARTVADGTTSRGTVTSGGGAEGLGSRTGSAARATGGRAGRGAVAPVAPVAPVEPAELAAWILESGLRVRFQTQLHKAIWGPDRRGV